MSLSITAKLALRGSEPLTFAGKIEGKKIKEVFGNNEHSIRLLIGMGSFKSITFIGESENFSAGSIQRICLTANKYLTKKWQTKVQKEVLDNYQGPPNGLEAQELKEQFEVAQNDFVIATDEYKLAIESTGIRLSSK